MSFYIPEFFEILPDFRNQDMITHEKDRITTQILMAFMTDNNDFADQNFFRNDPVVQELLGAAVHPRDGENDLLAGKDTVNRVYKRSDTSSECGGNP